MKDAKSLRKSILKSCCRLQNRQRRPNLQSIPKSRIRYLFSRLVQLDLIARKKLVVWTRDHKGERALRIYIYSGHASSHGMVDDKWYFG